MMFVIRDESTLLASLQTLVFLSLSVARCSKTANITHSIRSRGGQAIRPWNYEQVQLSSRPRPPSHKLGRCVRNLDYIVWDRVGGNAALSMARSPISHRTQPDDKAQIEHWT